MVTDKTATRSKAQKQHIVFQHYLCADDEKLTRKDFKIFLIDNNEGLWPQQEILVYQSYIQRLLSVMS